MDLAAAPNNTLGTTNAISDNSTASTEDNPGLHAFAIIACMICVGTITCNLFIILAFIRDRTIRNPFSYYLLNVAISDLGFAVFSMSGFVWFTLNPNASTAYCPYYNFLDNLFATSIGHAIMLISLDRLCSLYSPLRYRNIRSVKFTLTMCACTWTYLLVLLVPYNLMDALWYNEMKMPCSINFKEQHVYSLVIEFLLYDFPPWFVLVSYVLVFVKLHGRAQVRQQGFPHKGHDEHSKASHAHTATHLHSSAAKAHEPTALHVVKPKDEGKFHRLFALLALCILVCFLPGNIYYLVVDFLPYWNDTLFAIVGCLQYLSCVFNPIIYHSSLPELRKAIKKLLLCR